jgi:hypothetical protein
MVTSPVHAFGPEMSTMKGHSQIVRSGLWEWLTGVGLERFGLIREENGWKVRGTIIALGERGPAEAVYSWSCDEAWQTRQADISLRDESGERSLYVIAKNGRWFENGHERKQLAGCVDIDLGWSPSTNTIAIRRLKLPIGTRSAPLTMAWVRFPQLTLEPLPQEYERVGAHRYIYVSRGGGFRAALDVDDEGVVVEYEGYWRRVAAKG